MKIEEILQECIRRYPIGSFYYGVRDNLPGERKHKYIVRYLPKIYHNTCVVGGVDCLYLNGRFAETDNFSQTFYEIY